MSDLIEIIGYCALVPAGIAAAVVCVARWRLPSDLYHRYAAATALTAAFVVAFGLSQSWSALVPSRHWHWLPYVSVGAWGMGTVAFASGVKITERKLSQLLLAVIAAYLLVPTWESLEPPRPRFILWLASYFFGLVVLAEPLATRFAASRLLAILAIVALCTAIAIIPVVSVTYGQLALVSAAALAGVWVASKFLAQDVDVRAAIPIAMLLVGGAAFVASIDPTPRLFELLVIPASPLMLWLFTFKQLNRRPGIGIALAQVAAILAPIVLVLVRILLGEQSADEY